MNLGHEQLIAEATKLAMAMPLPTLQLVARFIDDSSSPAAALGKVGPRSFRILITAAWRADSSTSGRNWRPTYHRRLLR